MNMVSRKLKNIFLITLVSIYIHGIEEILTGFPHVDSFMKIGSDYFNITPEQFYWMFHLSFWVLLPVLYIVFHRREKIALFLFSLFGFFFVVELHHIAKAFYSMSYYPGLITALVYPFIGVVYWKELTKNWRGNYER